MEGTKIEEIMHKIFCIVKDIYQQTKRATMGPAQRVKPDPQKDPSLKFYNTGDKKKALQAPREEIKK